MLRTAHEDKVKHFLLQLRKKGSVVNIVVANATTKALISRSNGEYRKLVTLDSTTLAKVFFRMLDFVNF